MWWWSSDFAPLHGECLLWQFSQVTRLFGSSISSHFKRSSRSFCMVGTMPLSLACSAVGTGSTRSVKVSSRTLIFPHSDTEFSLAAGLQRLPSANLGRFHQVCQTRNESSRSHPAAQHRNDSLREMPAGCPKCPYAGVLSMPFWRTAFEATPLLSFRTQSPPRQFWMPWLSASG